MLFLMRSLQLMKAVEALTTVLIPLASQAVDAESVARPMESLFSPVNLGNVEYGVSRLKASFGPCNGDPNAVEVSPMLLTIIQRRLVREQRLRAAQLAFTGEA